MFHISLCTLLVLLLAASSPQSKPPAKPDYTGTWKFNPAKSKLQIAAPDSTIFVIEHREPHFRLSRTHVFAGKSDTWGIELTTDGKEVVRDEPNRKLRCRMSWESDSLVFHVRILMPDGEEVTDHVKYVLAVDRKSFTAYESMRGKTMHADNVWVLEKQQ